MSARIGLTPRQRDLLEFIGAYGDRTGCSPSFEEMSSALGGMSKSGIHRLVVALEERGFIRRFPNRARSIDVTNREPTLPTDLERSVALVCEALQIDRREFEKRAAVCFINTLRASA